MQKYGKCLYSERTLTIYNVSKSFANYNSKNIYICNVIKNKADMAVNDW